MPRANEASKPNAPAKPKAKPAVKTMRKAAEPKTRAAAKEPAAKAASAGAKAKRTRASTRRPIGTAADLLKTRAEFEEIKKNATDDLRKKYYIHISESEKNRTQYQALFSEVLIASVTGKAASSAKKTSRRGYTLEQVKMFLEQTKKGGEVKIPGKNTAGVARIKAAYEKSRGKDAKSALSLLK